VAGVAPRTGIAVVGIGPQPRHQRRAHGRLTAASNFTNADPGRRAGLRPNVNGDGGPADGDTWRRITPVTE